jgi:class 3 adenylate cyclase
VTNPSHNAGRRLRRFFAELRRRKLIGAMTAYAIGAWVLVQVASVVLPAFEAPPWALRVTIIAAFAGAPFAVLVAWMFNLTAAGFVRTADLELPPAQAEPVPELPAQAEPLAGLSVAQDDAGAGPERRQVTILYAGVAVRGPDEDDIDPEVERDAAPAVRDACERIAHEFEGYTGTATGNDLAVYFGVPTAHEDDALRAVRAGMAMLKAVSELNRTWTTVRGVRVELRVSVHTGTVVADNLGAGRGGPISISGDAVKVPAAMQFSASADELLIASSTHRLIEDMVDCDDRGVAMVGGRTSEHLYRVTRVTEGKARNAPGQPVAFVGRDKEQALLEEKWRLSRTGAGQAVLASGEGQTVLVSGEPGIGKSLIVQRVAEIVARDPDARIAIGQCSPYHRQRSLFPIAGMLQRDIIGLEAEADDARRTERLIAFLQAAGLDLPQSMPLFGPLLAVPQPYPALQLAPDLQQRALLEQIVSILTEGSERSPLLVVVEDLHWADAATLDFLSLLIDQLPTSRMLLLLTFRPEFVPMWGARSNMVHLPMGRLSHEAAEQIATRIAGARVIPRRVLDRIVERADGVPLFVEELTKSVLESGLLDKVDDGDDIHVAIPRTLQESLAARLDRLGPTKRLAQIAATIGREFSYPLLAAVADMDEGTLDRLLDELASGEFIYRKGIGHKARYIFKHALIQDAAYGSLLKSRRREIHGRIAAALEEKFPELGESQPELLALHFGEAALHEQAVKYGLAAGRHAVRRSANNEAVYHLQRCLEALKEVPQGHARDLTELSVQMTLMPAVVATKGYGAAELEHTCRRALELCDAVGDVPDKVFAIFGLWMFHVVRANHRTSVELAHRFDELARASGDDHLAVEADLILGIAHFFVADLDRAASHLEACVASYDPARHGDHAYRFGQDPRVIAMSYLSWMHWIRGDDARALQASADAMAAARGLEHPLTLSFALSFAAWLHVYRGNAVDARRFVDELEQLCNEYGILVFLAHARVIDAWLECEVRNDDASRKNYVQSIDEFRALGARCFVPLWQTHLAEVYLEAGELAASGEMLDQARDAVAASGETWAVPDLHRVRARLWRALSREPGAVAAELSQAIAAARRMDGRAWETRAGRDRA